MEREIEIELDCDVYRSAVAAYYEDGTLDDDEPSQAYSRAFAVDGGIRVDLSNAEYSRDHHHFAEVRLDANGKAIEVVGIIYTLRSEDLGVVIDWADTPAARR